MFSKEYYDNLRQKLTEKEQRNIQNLMSAAFNFVKEQEDIIGRVNEIKVRQSEELTKKTEENKKSQGEKKK